MLRKWQKRLSLLCLGSMLAGLWAPAGVMRAEEGVELAAAKSDLFVTEIHPDNLGAEAYEFFELYNASGSDLNLSNYSLIYNYTDNPGSNKAFVVPDNVVIPSGQAMVMWYNKTGVGLDDFNIHFGTGLTSSQIIQVTGFDGFANGGKRGVIVQDSSGKPLANANYLSDDVSEGTSAHYYPPTSGGEQTIYERRGAATPGSVASEQLRPQEEVQAPVILHIPVTSVSIDEDVLIQADISIAGQGADLSAAEAVDKNEQDESASSSLNENPTVIEDTYESAGENEAEQQAEAAGAPDGVVEEETADQQAEDVEASVAIPEMEAAAEQQITDQNMLEEAAQIEAAQQQATVTAAVYYRSMSETEFHVLNMSKAEGMNYTASIPKTSLTDPQLIYYIEAEAHGAVSRTEQYTVNVEQADVDYNEVPALLVTELVPDSTNVGGADGYEFIEVYNNTNQDINLKNYKLYYRYTDSGPSADVIWPTDHEEMMISSQETIVFWVINSANGDKTAADFNANYGSNLVENDNLYRVYSDGMANGGKRAAVIGTNTHIDIASAAYDNDDETQADKGIFYRYPTGGRTEMLKYSAGLLDATPGVVDPVQIPSVPVQLETDPEAPVLQFADVPDTVDQLNNIKMAFGVTDHTSVKSVVLFYKTDKDSEFTKRYLYLSYDDSNYHYTVYSPELIGSKQLEYYLELSDGTNERQTEPKFVEITGNVQSDELRLNVQEDQIISGNTMIKGTQGVEGEQDIELFIDDKAVPAEETFDALEHDAYFAFEVIGVNYYFKNAVTSGEEILHTFQDPINQYETLTVPIDAQRFREGNNVLSIRAGSKSSPFDEREEENKDDFQIRNIRLVLADGTVVYDPSYSNPQEEIKMGDSSGRYEYIDFAFNLTAEELRSTAYAWDTRKAEDGEHDLTAEAGEERVSASVIVDNTAPNINPNLEEGKEYRGEFTIDAHITDELAGVKESHAELDGEVITLPYETSSSKLSAGEHQLKIQAEDQAGNMSEVAIRFIVPEENPLKPELVSPKNGAEDVALNAELKIKVTDPASDVMDVSFYKGYLHDAKQLESFKGYRNAADVEPPKEEVPAGEKAMTKGDYTQIANVDGQYLTDDSMEQFPYHRFEAKLNSSVKDTDQVLLEWVGKSLEGRKVSLYAFRPDQQKWELLDQQIAGDEDFKLEAMVTAGNYRSGGKIQMMVQDELPVSEDPYDFSFVWMSDTQYYSESYPETYRKIANWIGNQKEEQKIKYVIHTGDIVDESDKEYQWIEADKNMKVLEEANIPYGVLAGNHDVSNQFGTYDEYWKYFGAWRFEDQPHYGESYKNNMGHYDLISSNGNDFIIVYMGWGLGQPEIDWMNEVLAKYPERKAILAFHEYLLVSGNRAPIADKVYEEVILPNENVIAALSGHYHDAELKVDEIDDDGDGTPDRSVYQMLADYQGAEAGGLGYIRLMQFDMQNNKLHMKTYSPLLDDYNYYDPTEYPGKDEFSLDLDLQGKLKRVATDYAGIKVYTNELIDKAAGIDSGSEASVNWSGLANNSVYQWYAVAEDEHSGSTKSDIWHFSTGKFGGNPGTDNPGTGNTGNQAGGGSSEEQKRNPVIEKGIISVQVTSDGKAVIAQKDISEALTQTEEYITIRQEGIPGESGQPQLQIETEGLRLLHEEQKDLHIHTGSLNIVVPYAAMQGEAMEEEWLTLHIKFVLDDESRGWIEAAKTTPALQPSNLVADIHWYSGDRSLTALAAPVQVNWQINTSDIDPEYAGIYRVHATGAKYIYGKWKDGVVTFETDGTGLIAVMEYHIMFHDMQNHWAKEITEKMAARHIVKGTSELNFKPNASVSRADFAVMAMRSLGIDRSEDASSFEDVADQAYYANAVAAAEQLGIMQGSGGHFRPLDQMTREEAVVVLMRLFEHMEITEGTPNNAHSFTDMSTASDWAQEAILAATREGLISGRTDGSFDPHDTLTRAETAQLIYNLLQK
ncbi:MULTISPECIES: S-layer homology domain-containing protein [Paenibacillus]|uniref:S-layer homology domain-containing protein n=1 Tax=Paenibacillus urinalis TaxID=521520 RepID=A0AAX3N0P1_9BACL|nr:MULTISPECIES: S-layer homology domain-containing protein [Paenibacillus]WDH82936.1 S-layer homology domain-containing protein [Paenibacillus urinalis]WDI02680.1 S-layer homology domain-containing protein [Paenibacillus urinalis]